MQQPHNNHTSAFRPFRKDSSIIDHGSDIIKAYREKPVPAPSSLSSSYFDRNIELQTFSSSNKSPHASTPSNGTGTHSNSSHHVRYSFANTFQERKDGSFVTLPNRSSSAQSTESAQTISLPDLQKTSLIPQRPSQVSKGTQEPRISGVVVKEEPAENEETSFGIFRLVSSTVGSLLGVTVVSPKADVASAAEAVLISPTPRKSTKYRQPVPTVKPKGPRRPRSIIKKQDEASNTLKIVQGPFRGAETRKLPSHVEMANRVTEVHLNTPEDAITDETLEETPPRLELPRAIQSFESIHQFHEETTSTFGSGSDSFPLSTHTVERSKSVWDQFYDLYDLGYNVQVIPGETPMFSVSSGDPQQRPILVKTSQDLSQEKLETEDSNFLVADRNSSTRFEEEETSSSKRASNNFKLATTEAQIARTTVFHPDETVINVNTLTSTLHRPSKMPSIHQSKLFQTSIVLLFLHGIEAILSLTSVSDYESAFASNNTLHGTDNALLPIDPFVGSPGIPKPTDPSLQNTQTTTAAVLAGLALVFLLMQIITTRSRSGETNRKFIGAWVVGGIVAGFASVVVSGMVAFGNEDGTDMRSRSCRWSGDGFGVVCKKIEALVAFGMIAGLGWMMGAVLGFLVLWGVWKLVFLSSKQWGEASFCSFFGIKQQLPPRNLRQVIAASN
ncbi:hypothetical protein BCR33DRAFT_714054 [Rhizoclosmatium globosum]|uniref:Uncharacterized protein n=1 Tax=Rhizoclosmatium globosum TaxID=329046 RepID=A0A1Y2CPL6_9FUNG|nr:hypothetical protein BCR33DRAFT_714054 [Rhizoclosmatium globosum]|eukprot:ORY48961.1 hypothetical protein BCR33DRAFT_714054 [Rhizoclosmatium globosum]